MSYIGKEPADSFISFAKQDFSTSVTTSYTLDNAVTNENELALFINFVRQEPTTGYTASGTTLTLTSATASGDDMYCVYLGQAKQTVNAPDGSVGISQLSATGTKDATTFLRGDNTFAEAGGGKVLQVLTATDQTKRTTTSTSFVTASNTLSVDITPSATSSKVLIMISTVIGNDTEEAQAISTIYRDSTNLGNGNSGMLVTYHYGGTTRQSASLIFLDSPSSTSQLTYQLYVRGTGGNTEINYDGGSGNGGKGSIIVMEIGA